MEGISVSTLIDFFHSFVNLGTIPLQMFFASSMLHVHLFQWQDSALVQRAVLRCSDVWESIRPDQVSFLP